MVTDTRPLWEHIIYWLSPGTLFQPLIPPPSYHFFFCRFITRVVGKKGGKRTPRKRRWKLQRVVLRAKLVLHGFWVVFLLYHHAAHHAFNAKRGLKRSGATLSRLQRSLVTGTGRTREKMWRCIKYNGSPVFPRRRVRLKALKCSGTFLLSWAALCLEAWRI